MKHRFLRRGDWQLWFWNFVGSGIVELDAETALTAPAEIKFKLAALIRNVWQQNYPAPRDGKIPAAVRVRHFFGIPAAPHELLVGDADDVKIEIVEWIAQIPFQRAMAVARQIPGGRDGVVGIFQPPDGIQLVVEMDFGQARIWRNVHAVPRRGICSGGRAFHLHRRPARSWSRKNGFAADEK